jgi:lipopolysaccharide/colanic/teichoic acid biosynthesis glycosyltransferase
MTIKRLVDVVVASVALVLLAPLLFLVALLIKLDSAGPVFFRQERMGQGVQPFLIYKFRTMVRDAAQKGGPLTLGRDSRITRLGRWLRKTKIDELPQLLNILKGEMGLVGPRPEVRKYVELFPREFERILQIKPGLTDLASIKYRNETEVLEGSEDPEQEYVRCILPDKIRLAKEYVAKSSFLFDLKLILRTLLRVIGVKLSTSP